MKNQLNKILQIGFLLVAINTYSQNIDIQIGREFGVGKLDYFWRTEVKDKNGNKRDILSQDFYANITTKIKGNFYLKTSIGTNEFKSNPLHIEWDVNGEMQSAYTSVSKNQIYMSFSPELRHNFYNNLVGFFNVGLSHTKVLYKANRQFSFSTYNVGYTLNTGLNITFNKNLGLGLNMGYRKDISVMHNSESPDISINKIYFQYGLIYLL